MMQATTRGCLDDSPYRLVPCPVYCRGGQWCAPKQSGVRPGRTVLPDGKDVRLGAPEAVRLADQGAAAGDLLTTQHKGPGVFPPSSIAPRPMTKYPSCVTAKRLYRQRMLGVLMWKRVRRKWYCWLSMPQPSRLESFSWSGSALP